jgi:shikimate dehydrogenase
MRRCRYGLIGAGIGASLSPALHEAEGRHHGLDVSYAVFDTARSGPSGGLARLLDETEAAGFAGINITHPFKQSVVELIDWLAPPADDIGAVNTIVFRDGGRRGYNTDGYGFSESFRRGLPGAPVDRVVQLGAGGAGAACAYAQLTADVGQLTVIDPDADQRQGFLATVRDRFDRDRLAMAVPDDLPALLGMATGLVNTSPIGMHAHPGTPLPVELLHAGLWVVDIIYAPVETTLLRAAQARGLRAINGAAMLAFQAAAGFELITGVVPDTSRMLDHLDRLLTQRQRPDVVAAGPRPDHTGRN